MLTLYLVRHGETDSNAEGRLQGHLPVPLNARGRRQADRLAQRLAGVPLDAILSSDLPRAQQTAEIIATAKGLPVFTDARWREINLGHWQGKLYREVKQAMDAADWHSPSGESRAQMRARVLHALEDLPARYDGKSILLVAHGGSCHTILAHIAGPDYGHAFHSWHNTAISTLAWERESGWSVKNLYDDTHLQGDAISFAEATSR